MLFIGEDFSGVIFHHAITKLQPLRKDKTLIEQVRLSRNEALQYFI